MHISHHSYLCIVCGSALWPRSYLLELECPSLSSFYTSLAIAGATPLAISSIFREVLNITCDNRVIIYNVTIIS